MIFGDNLQLLPLLIPALLLSLILHEVAHARMALAFGDPTALRAGRITLNPLVHLDPIGTVALLLIGFGWARPVPVNPYLLRPPGLGDIMVSIAGPLTNLALAITAGCMVRIMVTIPGGFTQTMFGEMILKSLLFTMLINLILCIFNMIPLAPLDGHHILGQLLPRRMREGYMIFQRQYGSFLLMVLIFGPQLLSMISGRPVPSPISFVFVNAQILAEKFLLM